MSGHILASSRSHSASLSNTKVGGYSYFSSAPFGKPIQHKGWGIFLLLLGPIWQAYPTQRLGDILTSPWPHLASLSNTKVGGYSYFSSAPFGKPIQRKCREIFLPFLGPIRKAYPTQSLGDILTSPRPHLESLSNANVGMYSCLSSAPFDKPIQHKVRGIFFPLLGPIRKAYPTQSSEDILTSPRPHSESLSNANSGRYSCLSSAPFGKPIQHKGRGVFLLVLGPIRKAYPTMSGGILAPPRHHSASLSNTKVGGYSYFSSAPFGKPIQRKSRDISLPLFGLIRKASLAQMSGNILVSPWSHPENLPSTNVTLTCYVIMWHLIYHIF